MPGLLFVLTGPSGVGKSTIRQRLCEDPRIVRSVSCTTRAPRAGEREGVDYFFVTEAEFQRRVAAGELLEHARVFGRHRYGTPRAWVEARIAEGKIVILEIEVQGARQTVGCGLPRYAVFVNPPSWEALERRLRGRKTESADAIEARLATARDELAAAGEFDDQVVNDDLDGVVAEIRSLLATRLSAGVPHPADRTPQADP